MTAGRPRTPRILKVVRGTLRPDRDIALSRPVKGPPLVKPRAHSHVLALYCALLEEVETMGAAEIAPAMVAQIRGLSNDLGIVQLAKLTQRAYADASTKPAARPADPAAKFFE